MGALVKDGLMFPPAIILRELHPARPRLDVGLFFEIEKRLRENQSGDHAPYRIMERS